MAEFEYIADYISNYCFTLHGSYLYGFHSDLVADKSSKIGSTLVHLLSQIGAQLRSVLVQCNDTCRETLYIDEIYRRNVHS